MDKVTIEIRIVDGEIFTTHAAVYETKEDWQRNRSNSISLSEDDKKWILTHWPRWQKEAGLV